MKFVLLFLTLMVSVTVKAEPQNIQQSVEQLKEINLQLLSNKNTSIDVLLEQRISILDGLMLQLRNAQSSQLIEENIDSKLSFLESRIEVNKGRGNDLAALRDQTKLKTYVLNRWTRQYLEYLIEASNQYQLIEDIVTKSQQELDAIINMEAKLVLPKVEIESAVFGSLQKNYRMFLQASHGYRDILNYVINNPRKIASVHWFQELSLLSAISSINQFDFIKPVNSRLSPFKVDVGGIVISLVIILLVYFSYPFVFNCTRWCVENYLIDKEVGQQELIYHEIRRPARTLVIFFGINLGMHAFFYKTDYNASLQGLSFIIYSLIIIWLFFKIIDSIVLVQVEKIASSNKELRKELFNLGVQVVKGLVLIIVLAFGLNHFGISLTAIVSTLGVGGLAFALAAKDTLSNLFGGVTILFDNVFRMGDWIKVGDVEGTVAEIGLRSTTIRTFDNALITIPNSIISISSVMNWNRRAVGRRIKMHVGVTYESNMDDIKQGLQDIRDMLKEHPKIANPKHKVASKKRDFKFTSQADTHGIKSTQLVFLDRYNDFSIDILIYCFARTVDWAEWLAVKEDILFQIAAILEKNNLEFAYPTQVRIHRSEKTGKSLDAVDFIEN